MEPKIVNREAFTVVGIKYRGTNEQNEIPQVWQALMPRVPEIKNITKPDVAYGISGNLDQASGEFDYVAGYEVSAVEDIPEGMVRWEIPAGAYAVFSTTLPAIGETFTHAYKTWLPQSGHQATGGPDFELYDRHFDPQNPNSTFDLYIPLK